MTSLVTGPSGDSGALPNQAINGCQTSTPAPLVILLLCIPLSPLPSPPHSYSCWEHRPRLFPTSPARHHGESVFHPSPVLRSPFQEQLRSSIPHWEVIYPGSRIRIPVVSCILHPQFLLFSIISSSPSSFPLIYRFARHRENPACLSQWKTAFGSGPYCVVPRYYRWVKGRPLLRSLSRLLSSISSFL